MSVIIYLYKHDHMIGNMFEKLAELGSFRMIITIFSLCVFAEIPLDPTDDQMANAVYEEITHANGHIKDPNAFEV